MAGIEMTISEALDPTTVLPADRANAALDLLRVSYCELLLKHDALLKKHEIMQRAAVRVLDVLAAQTKRQEGCHDFPSQ